MAVVVLAGTRWYRGANICATVLVRILFRLPRSIALPDKYGMERVEMVYRSSVRLGCVAKTGPRSGIRCILTNKLYEISTSLERHSNCLCLTIAMVRVFILARNGIRDSDVSVIFDRVVAAFFDVYFFPMKFLL